MSARYPGSGASHRRRRFQCSPRRLRGRFGDARATELFLPATSLGGTASLIELLFTFEGPGSRSPENMVRISIRRQAGHGR
ncbi:hypothetical protein ACLQ26_28975 [Micromonospora sp. DT43]|uniref:hypothetical protein n=1 Tax=Micromonospora sp. DT43 TaxID=3393440 RepID=UPI003CF22D0E